MAAYGEAMAATREAATRQQQQPPPQPQYGTPATQYGAPQYGAPAQGQAPQYGAQGGLPPPWQVAHAPGQPRPYYYNPATGVTTWEPPPPQPSYAPPAQPYGAYARPYAAPPAQSYGATQAAAAAAQPYAAPPPNQYGAAGIRPSPTMQRYGAAGIAQAAAPRPTVSADKIAAAQAVAARFVPGYRPPGQAAPPRPPACLLYTSPSPRDQRGSRMPSSA